MTKKKSLLTLILAFCFIVPSVLLFSACGHKHSYSEEWTRTATEHYHSATCKHTDEKKDVEAHNFDAWSTKSEADYGVDKVEKRTCSVCSYEETRDVPNTALHAKARTIGISEDSEELLNAVYNGQPYVFETELIEVSGGENQGDITIQYKVKGADDEYTLTAPTNAGTYAFIIKISGTAEWESATSKVGSFTISPATLVAPSSFSFVKEYDETNNIYEFTADAGVKANDKVYLVGPNSISEPSSHIISFTGADVKLSSDNYIVSIDAEQTISVTINDTQRDFYMPINDIFTISGRGLVIVGTIARGTVSVGDTIEINTTDGIKTVEVLAIEINKKSLTSATIKEEIGILIGEQIEKSFLARGQILSKPNSMTYGTKFVAEIYVLTKAEGGRQTPIFTNYQPVLSLYGLLDVKSTLIFDNVEMISTGETGVVTITISSSTPLWQGLTFSLKEGAKIVARGTIVSIIE